MLRVNIWALIYNIIHVVQFLLDNDDHSLEIKDFSGRSIPIYLLSLSNSSVLNAFKY